MSAQPTFLRADDIHARLGPTWPSVLAQLGIAEEFLRQKKSGPCPACGGRDRYTFDNRRGRGDFICRGCGAGDGFAILMRVHGWDFPEARRRVLNAAGFAGESLPTPRPTPAPTSAELASPSAKVRSIVRSSCVPSDCPDAVTYLESRGIWPLPEGCMLKAHPSLDYWHDGQRARYPGLVAEVRDAAGELVTAHVTYLSDGRKLAASDCRKLLSPLTGRDGCAVRLMPVTGDTLGVAEGIETALSASVLDGLPVWAALNTSLLAKFEPPQGCARLAVYADRDEAGFGAALRLFERLQGRVRVEARIPTSPAKDWNDVLLSRGKP